MSDYALLNDPPHTTQEPDADLRETQVVSALMRQGKFLTLRQDIVWLPDGHSASREHLIHPGAAMMIPLFNDGTVLMKRQFRYPVGRMMIGLPIGKLDPQGGAFACGKCELREETGYTVGRWDYLMHIHPVISYSTEFINTYLARDLKQGETMLDEGGFLETFIISAGQLVGWIHDGKISDVKIAIDMFWLEKTLSGTWAPSAT